MSAKTVLIDAGYEDKGIVKCGKCGEPVEMYEKDGRAAYFNTKDHPVEPGAVHEFSCGHKEPDHSLPPIPDQNAFVKDNG